MKVRDETQKSFTWNNESHASEQKRNRNNVGDRNEVVAKTEKERLKCKPEIFFQNDEFSKLCDEKNSPHHQDEGQ